MARVGGPRVFFDVIGIFNATRMIADQKAQMAVVESIVLDSVEAITQSFAGIGATIDSLTQSTVPLAMSLSEATIEFEKFAGENEQIQQNIIETGKQFGFTADEALIAGARMAQLSSILGEGTTDIATELGQQFALISGMGTEEAMQRLINLQQQTNFMYGELTQSQYRLLSAEQQRNVLLESTTEVLDQLNTIENKSASSMKQMTFVMNQFAAQAHLTGESIGMMAAQSATLIEAGEEQGKAGRALRMVYARLGSNIQDNNDKLHALGVETHDATTGALRPLSEIVNDLAVAFEDMSLAEQQAIVQAVAGNDHYVRLTKLIQNVDRMNQLAEDSIYNQATAQEELNRVLDASSTKYKAAQADLSHYQAQFGEYMIPALTESVQLQTRLYKSAMSFGDIGERFASSVVKIREFSRIMGGFFDTYLNLRSVNIALETHRAVIKSLNGEEIVRTDQYRKQGLFSGVTMANVRTIAQVNAVLAEQEYNKAVLAEKVAATNEKTQTFRDMEVNSSERAMAIDTERNTLAQQLLVTEAERIAIAQFEGNISEHRNNMLRGEVILENMLTSAQRESLLAKRQQGEAEMKSLMATQRQLEVELASLNLGQKAIENREFTNQQIQKSIASRTKELQQVRTLLEQDAQARLLMQSKADIQERINSLNMEELVVLDQLGFAKRELQYLTDYEIQQLIELNALEQNLNTTRQSKLVLDSQRLVAERKIAFGTQENIILGETFSGTMTKLSMSAGLASMAFMMFSDSENAMRASMILMMISMVPMVGQMFAMTGATEAYSIAAMKAAFATGGLSAALNTLPGMILLTAGLAAVGLALSALLPKAKSATAELEDFNSALSTTLDFANMLNEEGGLTTPKFYKMQALIGDTDVMNVGLKKLKYFSDETTRIIEEAYEDRKMFAQNDPMYEYYSDQIREMEIYNTSLKSLMGRQVGMYYDSIDEYTTSGGMLREIIRDINKGYIDMPKGEDITFFKDVIMEDASSSKKQDYFLDATRGDGIESYFDVEYVDDGIQRTVSSFEDLIVLLEAGAITFEDLSVQGKNFVHNFVDAYINSANVINAAMETENDLISDMGSQFSSAEEKMRSFANAREELFFGGKSQYMTGEMMKQVVNKGVENLYSNVELLMTNNFYGLTMDEAIDNIASRVTSQLVQQGVPLSSGGMSV